MSSGAATSSQQAASTDTDYTELEDDVLSNADTHSVFSADLQSLISDDGAFSPVPPAKKRKASQVTDSSDILREFIACRPKPSDFLPQQPQSAVHKFFESMADTVSKFSPMAIARIKLKIANIVGEEEIAWAQESMQIIYVEATGGVQPTATSPPVQQPPQTDDQPESESFI